jgi:hypothetical protein
MIDTKRDFVIRQAKYGPAWVELEFVREDKNNPYEVRRRLGIRYIPKSTWKRIVRHYARPTRRTVSPRESFLLALQQDVSQSRQKA